MRSRKSEGLHRKNWFRISSSHFNKPGSISRNPGVTLIFLDDGGSVLFSIEVRIFSLAVQVCLIWIFGTPRCCATSYWETLAVNNTTTFNLSVTLELFLGLRSLVDILIRRTGAIIKNHLNNIYKNVILILDKYTVHINIEI